MSRKTYRIAVAQLRVDPRDCRLNAAGILEALDVAAGEKADFLVTPEMALTGYHGRFDGALRDALVSDLRAATAEAGVTVILGAGDRRGGKVYNEQLILSGDGRMIGRHAKMVPTRQERRWCVAGRTLRVFRDRGLAFGCLICNDLWVTPGTGATCDPRLTLRLARRGARAIFHSVFSGAEPRYIPFHESNLALRAQAGGLYIAAANAAVPGKAVNCASGIMGPDGQWVVRCRRRGRQFAVADLIVRTDLPRPPEAAAPRERTVRRAAKRV